MKSRLYNKYIEMCSIHNAGKSVIGEIYDFIIGKYAY